MVLHDKRSCGITSCCLGHLQDYCSRQRSSGGSGAYQRDRAPVPACIKGNN